MLTFLHPTLLIILQSKQVTPIGSSALYYLVTQLTLQLRKIISQITTTLLLSLVASRVHNVSIINSWWHPYLIVIFPL